MTIEQQTRPQSRLVAIERQGECRCQRGCGRARA